MKTGWSNRDLYESLVARHGSRVPRVTDVLLRRGWYPLADRLLTELSGRYPGVRVTRLMACSGYLSVDYRGGERLSLADSYRLGKVVQGYITESCASCEECGSGHGIHYTGASFGIPGHTFNGIADRVLCAECKPGFVAAFRLECAAYDLRRQRPETVH